MRPDETGRFGPFGPWVYRPSGKSRALSLINTFFFLFIPHSFRTRIIVPLRMTSIVEHSARRSLLRAQENFWPLSWSVL